jgi:hypothetical protein
MNWALISLLGARRSSGATRGGSDRTCWGVALSSRVRLTACVGKSLIATALALSVSGCAVTTVWTDSSAQQSIEHLQANFRRQAAAVSRSAWDDVRSSPSRIGSLMSMLIEGRKADEPKAAAAAAPKSPAADYLAQKASNFDSKEQQLSSVVADVRHQTAEIDTFIRFADALATDYSVRLASLDAGPNLTPKSHAEVQCDADRHVLEQTVERLRKQKATYEEAVRTLKKQQPSLDTARFAQAITLFDGRIDRLVALDKRMAQAAPYDTTVVAQSAG